MVRALVALGILLALAAYAAVDGAWELPYAGLEASLRAVAGALGVALAGAGIVAWLPVGSPVGRARSGALARAATAFVLGDVLARFLAPGAERVDALFVPWIWVPLALALARRALGVLPLVPRHEEPAAPSGAAARALACALALLLLAAPDPAHAFATAALLHAAARGLRVPPDPALVGALLAVAAVTPGVTRPSAFGLVALAMVGIVAWHRRADARGLALAAVGAALAGMHGGVIGAVLAPLVALSLAPSRPRAIGIALIAGAVVSASLFATGSAPELVDFSFDAPFAWLFAALALVLGAITLARARAAPGVVVGPAGVRARAAPAGAEVLAIAASGTLLVGSAPLTGAFACAAVAAAALVSARDQR